MARTAVNEIVHHRVARQTGATITVERTGPGSWVEQEEGWMTHCFNHGQLCMHDTRRDAEGWAAQPSMWCGDCQLIASGKLSYITDGKVE